MAGNSQPQQPSRSEVPEVVVTRLPQYVRILSRLLQEGTEVVSSQQLGEKLQVTPAQIRKDLSYFGRFGKQGRGAAEWLGVEQRAPVRVGTLSKALGAMGGFVTGSEELCDWLWNRARTQIFSTALPPSVCAAACAAVEIIENEPWRRDHLKMLSDRLRRGIGEIGLPMPPGEMGPIVPVVLHDAAAVLHVAERLQQRGVLVAAIRPPTVPPGTSRLRITLSCAHSEADVSHLLEALSEIVVTAER